MLLILKGVSVIDVTQGQVLDRQNITLLSGRIHLISPTPLQNVPDATQVLALDGMYVLPGLIDLHTHLLLHPYND